MMCKLCGGQMEFEEGTWGCVANCLNSPSKTEVQTFQDTYNQTIRIGSIVAYNCAGAVLKGVVKKIVKAKINRWPSPITAYGYTFHITPIGVDNLPATDGQVSKVKNPTSLISI